MSKSHWLVVALIGSLVVNPTITKAQVPDSTKEQVKEDAQDFVHDVLRGLLGPNWNLFANYGLNLQDRYMLQEAPNSAGIRALDSGTGYNLGLGAGVDILLRLGFRASYTYTSRNLNYRTNNGDGSSALNVDDLARLSSSTIALEVMRYMLPSGAAITPYGTVGVQGTWWSLHEKSPLVTNSGAGTQFGVNPLFSFGLQVKASQKWSGRFEATLGSGHNPFSGKRAFRSFAGPVIDEPNNIGRTDWRVAAVYHFGRPKMPSAVSAIAHK